jgi:hypothetical protein
MTIETRFSAARRPRASRSRSTVASRAIRRLSARSRSSCALNGILYKWTKTINDIVKKLSARPPTFSICYRDQQKVRRPRRPFEPYIMDDARRSARHRALKSGSIRFGDVAIPCIIRNLSTAGVALDVGPHARIPDQFTLIVHAENKIYSCTVIWRKEKRLGVAFY